MADLEEKERQKKLRKLEIAAQVKRDKQEAAIQKVQREAELEKRLHLQREQKLAKQEEAFAKSQNEMAILAEQER